MERTLAEVEAIPPDGLPTEERITRDMLRVVAELGIEEDDQRIHQLRVVDQMSGPQQTLPQLTSFQTGRHARRGWMPSSPGSTPTATYMDANTGILARGHGDRA